MYVIIVNLKMIKKDKSKVPLKNEGFTSSNETYNVFVNSDLFNSISEKSIKEVISDKRRLILHKKN